jgi:hypothetical protein
MKCLNIFLKMYNISRIIIDLSGCLEGLNVVLIITFAPLNGMENYLSIFVFFQSYSFLTS